VVLRVLPQYDLAHRAPLAARGLVRRRYRACRAPSALREIRLQGAETAGEHPPGTGLPAGDCSCQPVRPQGALDCDEPFQALLAQGMVQGRTYSHPDTGQFLTPAEVNVSGPGQAEIKGNSRTVLFLGLRQRCSLAPVSRWQASYYQVGEDEQIEAQRGRSGGGGADVGSGHLPPVCSL
jgi:hypothetical protein